MNPNPVLRRLGFSDIDRVVIIHTDDIGMCNSSVTAFTQLYDTGIISSGAVMVPCPWFLSALQIARAKPEVDLGVHLTLTSEWSSYRWGPISTRDPLSGLLDKEGYFYKTSEETQEKADPMFAFREMEMQIQRMHTQDFKPSHIDTHMGTVAHPKFMQGYIELALKYKLAIMMFRMDESGWQQMGLDEQSAKIAATMMHNLEDMGFPLLDQIRSMPLDAPNERLEKTKLMLQGLPAGITHFIIHPSVETEEIKAITPDWESRVADFHTFQNEAIRSFLADQGIYVIGYRQLQALIPDFA